MDPEGDEGGARPRRRRRGAPHICPHCTRVFKRSEHLGRHVRTHTKEKPFVCICGAAFTRRDLLTRHHRLSSHNGEAEDQPTSEPVSVGSLPGLDQAPVWTGHRGSSLVPEVGVTTGEGPNPEPQPYHEQQLIVPQPMFDYCHDINDNFHQFWEFAGFLDGIGLPAEWSPYLQGPDFIEPETSETASANVGSHGTRPGTPFNSWLPSAPVGDRPPGNPSDQDGPSREVTPPQFKITDEQRSRLNQSLQSFRSLLDPDFRLPSRHALTRYITSYFEGFHSHMVFMHVQTWSVFDSPLELVLSVATIGAQYCFEHRNAERLFHAGKVITFERLRQEAGRFGPKTASHLNIQNRSPQRRGNDDLGETRTICGSWEPIDTIRALINLMAYATWEMKTYLVQEAFALQSLLIHVLRDIGLEEDRIPQTDFDSEQIPLHTRWLAWVYQESVRRAKLIVPPLRTLCCCITSRVFLGASGLYRSHCSRLPVSQPQTTLQFQLQLGPPRTHRRKKRPSLPPTTAPPPTPATTSHKTKMSLNLEKHLVFYGAYHHNPVNIVIHMTCVPLILLSGFWMASNSPTLIPLPSWLTLPYLQLNGGTLAALTWGGLYVLLEPVAGTALALLCLAGAAGGNYALEQYDSAFVTKIALGIHVVCWILQFIGHGKFEGRAPALLDNLFQAIFLAPLFVWLELLFMLGYRPELQARVEKEVQLEIAKYRQSKAKAAAKNGKAE